MNTFLIATLAIAVVIVCASVVGATCVEDDSSPELESGRWGGVATSPVFGGMSFVVDGLNYTIGVDPGAVGVGKGVTTPPADLVIPSKVTHEEIQYDVTSIVNNAFKSCDELTSVTIPDSVETIGINAFNNCLTLASVSMPDSITSIGSNAFASCIALTSVTITLAEDKVSYGVLLGSGTECLGMIWNLPGQSFDHIDELIIDTGESINLSNIATAFGKKVTILPGTVATGAPTSQFRDASGNEIDDPLKRAGLVYTGDGTRFNATGAYVVFDARGGTPTPDTQIVSIGSAMADPGQVTKSGYRFAGWYAGGIKWDLSAPVNGYVPLAAYWIAEVDPDGTRTYTVTFDARGGYASVAAKTVTFGGTYGDLPTPVKTDCSFDGWFTDSVNGSRITSVTSVTDARDHVLYAHWTEDQSIDDTGADNKMIVFIALIVVVIMLLVLLAMRMNRG